MLVFVFDIDEKIQDLIICFIRERRFKSCRCRGFRFFYFFFGILIFFGFWSFLGGFFFDFGFLDVFAGLEGGGGKGKGGLRGDFLEGGIFGYGGEELGLREEERKGWL